MMHVTFEDDEFYKRKFNIKPFSIQVNKMSEEEIEECIQQHKSPKRGITNGILRWARSYREKNDNLNTSQSSASVSFKQETEKKCDYNCNTIDEEYYKQLYDIQELQINLPRANKENNNKKRKLAFVFDYLTFCFLMKICFSIVVAVFVLYFL